MIEDDYKGEMSINTWRYEVQTKYIVLSRNIKYCSTELIGNNCSYEVMTIKPSIVYASDEVIKTLECVI